jgi:2-polyprenyl-3-methyl-5-hydroxy-6-metoxy-1,4-benzoquinol methylase
VFHARRLEGCVRFDTIHYPRYDRLLRMNDSLARSSTVNYDRAGEAYWTQLWSQADLPRPVDPRDRSLRNHVRRAFDRYFRSHFVRPDDRGKRLLEVGCARSGWLGYFVREHGLAVTGLDYSEIGCRQSEAMLARDGVPGEILHGDLFDPPAACVGAFDFVTSFGVVEHFEDTAACLRALRRMLKPQGRIYTLIPNQIGMMGAVQRALDRRFWEMHVPLDAAALEAAHAAAGLRVVHGGYFMSSNFGVLNCSTYAADSMAARVRGIVRLGFVAASAAGWLVEDALGVALPPSRALSPYAHCVAINDSTS